MTKELNIPISQYHTAKAGNRFTGWIGRVALRLLGWRFSGNFPDNKKMLIAVAPHTSNWDFFIGLAGLFALRWKINFFGKHTIFVPPVNGLLRRWGGIPIDRRAAHGAVEQAAERIRQADQMILAIAPEGTRSRIDRWKSGFLQIAHRADIPVLLLGFDYAKKELVFGPLLSISADISSEMARVQRFFSTVEAKYPDQVSFSEIDK